MEMFFSIHCPLLNTYSKHNSLSKFLSLSKVKEEVLEQNMLGVHLNPAQWTDSQFFKNIFS